MQARNTHRAVSFVFAALVTLAMLGGINGLSQPEATTAVWAQAAAVVQPA